MDDEALLRLFLTGSLTEDEAADVELRLLADDGFFVLAEAVERDVLADCVQGRLSAIEEANVRHRLLASPAGQARLALAEDLTSVVRTTKRQAPAALLDELLQAPAERREAMARQEERFRQRELVDLLLERSRMGAFEDQQRAEEAARLALAVADRLDERALAAVQLADLRARVWARIANSLRVKGSLREAAAAFETAWGHLRQGTASPLERAGLVKLEASLHCDQRQFSKALVQLHEIVPVFQDAGENRLAIESLLGISHVHLQAGEPAEAFSILQQVLERGDLEVDPWLGLIVRHNLIYSAVEAGRYGEAEAMMAQTRPFYDRFPHWTQNRLQWLQGRIARGLGRLAEAEPLFEKARTGFFAESFQYDAALVSLDLASLYAEQGRTEELKPLAREVVTVFSAYSVHREALAAVIFLERAAAAERASLEVVAQVASFLKHSRHDPELRFGNSSSANADP